MDRDDSPSLPEILAGAFRQFEEADWLPLAERLAPQLAALGVRLRDDLLLHRLLWVKTEQLGLTEVVLAVMRQLRDESGLSTERAAERALRDFPQLDPRLHYRDAPADAAQYLMSSGLTALVVELLTARDAEADRLRDD